MIKKARPFVAAVLLPIVPCIPACGGNVSTMEQSGGGSGGTSTHDAGGSHADSSIGGSGATITQDAGGSGGDSNVGGSGGTPDDAANGGAAGMAGADTGPDSPQTCLGPFQPPIPVAGVNSTEFDACARLSPDELNIFFTSNRNNAGTSHSWDLYAASRVSVVEPFSNVIRLSSVNSDSEDACSSVTSDLLTLYFQTRRLTGSLEIWASTRVSVTAEFSVPLGVPALNPAGWDTWHPYVLPDSQAIYLSGQEPGQSIHMYRAALGPGGPSMPVKLDSLAWGEEQAPVPTPDELTLYFTRYFPSTSCDIFVATRSSAAAEFGAEAKVVELSTSSYEHVSWVSPDGCRVYITSDRPGTMGDLDIWVASRSP